MPVNLPRGQQARRSGAKSPIIYVAQAAKRQRRVAPAGGRRLARCEGLRHRQAYVAGR
jgi:hypothetical protein